MEKIIHISKSPNFIEITTVNKNKIFIKEDSIEEIATKLINNGYGVLVVEEIKKHNEYSFVLIHSYDENQYIIKFNNYYIIVFYKGIPSTVEIEIENIYFNDDNIIPIFFKIIDKTIKKITISKKYLVNWDGSKFSITNTNLDANLK
jgi:hypothetical protein